jgi:SnoaL-like domain
VFTFFLTLVEHIESEVTTESLFAAGDHVVQTGRTRGTVRANGASFDIPEVHVWELRDGKIVQYQSYIDTPAMLEALRRLQPLGKLAAAWKKPDRERIGRPEGGADYPGRWGITVEAEIVESLERRVECDASLHTREMHAEAHVRS